MPNLRQIHQGGLKKRSPPVADFLSGGRSHREHPEFANHPQTGSLGLYKKLKKILYKFNVTPVSYFLKVFL
jgi:hypothetical protein